MNIDNVIKEALRQTTKIKYAFKLGAVIFNRDRIIGTGYNRVFSYGGYDCQGNCAEVLAIKKTRGNLLRGASILVCRRNASGTLGMSKPCHRCAKLIKKSGIKKVIYSTPNGWKKYFT